MSGCHGSRPLRRVFTRQAVRQVDRRSIEDYGIPGIVLMENAARGLTLHALQMLGWPDRPPRGAVLVLAGGGNNGGDGFAAARHLHNAGVGSTLLLVQPAEKYRGDAAVNLEICRTMRLPVVEMEEGDDPEKLIASLGSFELILDGLLGTGLDSAVRSPVDRLIQAVNRQVTPVLAIDIPSGLDCDSGKPLGTAVRAEATVSFVGLKKGFLAPGAVAYTGRIVVTDIGAPRELIEELGEPVEEVREDADRSCPS